MARSSYILRNNKKHKTANKYNEVLFINKVRFWPIIAHSGETYTFKWTNQNFLLRVRAFTCVGSPCMICGHLANIIYNDWSEFMIFHGDGTEKVTVMTKSMGQISKWIFFYEIKAFHWLMWLIYIHPKYIYNLVRAIITIDIATHHDSIPK